MSVHFVTPCRSVNQSISIWTHTFLFPPASSMLRSVALFLVFLVTSNLTVTPFSLRAAFSIPGMPNLRKNPFSTDFDDLLQSTDKKVIFFYEQINDIWTNLRTLPYSVRLHCTFETHGILRAPSELFRLLPEISGFFAISIRQPWHTNDAIQLLKSLMLVVFMTCLNTHNYFLCVVH